MNEWLMSGLPNGPFRSAIALSRVVFQWVVEAGWRDEVGGNDSPLMGWGLELGNRPCCFKWLQSYGYG